ncbi:MAG: hemerythrin domain-containing protein [Burkholderiales bacterium]|nr:hemerythrin domain-containing protein [Burkholderiales bacterium]
MSHPSIKIIHAEHQALAAMLSSISLMLAEQRRNGHVASARDFEVLRAMLFYIDEFPERLHHRQESDLLFPLMRARTNDADEALARLDRDHANGESAILKLEHALLAWEMLGSSRQPAFEAALERYLDFYRAHMRLEEDVILPLAEKVLTDDDWTKLDVAFAQHRDPLTGHAPPAEYEALFSRIVRLAPAPIGLG